MRKKPDFHPDNLLIISGGHFIHDVFSSFLAVFLPLLINKFELSMVLAGFPILISSSVPESCKIQLI